ncbi:2-methylcitrate dehydratase PrpD [Mytilinidion resinicola]|uniref:2-methylcitrate dehydratase PrpD n=1 Tax=Mytilinidion resinicola TaxID=574789 RepID=A0A6A6Y888_9PEZI|nr:2-methylcitrate dehydratase PrpD [Mytilinidion resinicola]KAF2804184.1 2-methylcitrate dehydratase PrpD [Mytilinidion resinicola]
MAAQASDYDRVLQDTLDHIHHPPITSDSAYNFARLSLLDALGTAIANVSSADPICRRLIGPIVSGTTVLCGFRLPGTSFELDPVKGAFDLSSLISHHHSNLSGPPSTPPLPPSSILGALLATADWLSRTRTPPPTGVPQRTFLTVQIEAYELYGCLAAHNPSLSPTLLAEVTATACVAHLLELPEDDALAALSNAWADAGALRVSGAARQSCDVADAAARAVQHALLAQRGQAGVPGVLGAERWGVQDAVLGGMEVRLPPGVYGGLEKNAYFQMVPAAWWAVSAVEAALGLVHVLQERELSVEKDVQNIIVRTTRAGKRSYAGGSGLGGAERRRGDLGFVVAVVLLLEGEMVEEGDYEDGSAWATDPRVEALRGRMIVVEDEEFTRGYDDEGTRSAANGIKLLLSVDEEVPERVVEFPVGHPKREDTTVMVVEKFRKNLQKGDFSDERVAEILERVEVDDAEVADFVDLFWKWE